MRRNACVMQRRFLPPQVADAISEGGIDNLKSHRREVSVLFCDLRGFTPFAEQAEPEDVMMVLGELHGTLVSLVFAMVHDQDIAFTFLG